MKHPRLGSTIAVVALCGLLVNAATAQEAITGVRYGRLVIRGAMLVDGLGTPARGPLDIVIEGDSISELVPVDPVSLAGRRGSEAGEEPAPPKKADRVIEAQGMYVLPGFVDMHSHIPEGRVVPAGDRGRQYAYNLWLAHGVTTVRDVGSSAGLDVLANDKRRAAANEIAAPRIVAYAGWRGIGGAEGGFPTRAAIRARLEGYKKAGAEGIKVFGPTYTNLLNLLCEQARALGMGVAIHVAVGQVDAVSAARAGVNTIEHWYGIPDAAIPGVQRFPADYNFLNELDRFRYAGKLWREADPAALRQVMDVLLEQGTVLDPTFVAYEANRDLVRAQNLPWYPGYALPVMIEYWKPNPAHHGSYHYEWTTDDEVSWRENFQLWMAFVREFWRRGGKLTVASDPGGSFGLFGFTYVREMELYREMGLDPINIIEAASTSAARVLGLERLAGGVRAGALADLVIVDGNPLRDLKVLYGTGVTKLGQDGKVQRGGGVRYTIKEGVVFDAHALLKSVETMVQEARTRATQ
jgi:imidazolonepropionase-like amidohydrolase